MLGRDADLVDSDDTGGLGDAARQGGQDVARVFHGDDHEALAPLDLAWPAGQRQLSDKRLAGLPKRLAD